MVAYGNTPEGQKLKIKLHAQLTKSKPKLQKQISKAQQLFAKNQLDAFEALMEKEGASLAVDTAPFDPITRNKYYLKYNHVLSIGDNRIAEVRKQTYQNVATERIADYLQATNRFTEKAESIRGELEQAVANSSELPSAIDDAFNKLLDVWGKSTVMVIRSHAVAIAFDLEEPGSDNILVTISKASDSLTDAAIAAYVSMIGVVSETVSTENVDATYAKLLCTTSV